MPPEPQEEMDFGPTIYFSLLVIAVTSFFRPDVIPFPFFHFWKMDGLWSEALWYAWPIFLWGGGVMAISCFVTPDYKKEDCDPSDIFFVGTLGSIFAGVSEEVIFRWFLFYAGIALYTLLNWLTWGLFAWIFMHILGPIADFFTLGYFHNLLFHEYGWTIGAAILSSTSQFRDGHKYLGTFGWINSWFLGLYFFHIVFTFGLPAAIMLHILYDFLIYCVIGVDALIARKRMWG